MWNEKDLGKAKKAAAKYISDEHILIDPRQVPPKVIWIGFGDAHRHLTRLYVVGLSENVNVTKCLSTKPTKIRVMG